MNLRKTFLIAAVLPLFLLGLSFVVGTASADHRFSGDDDKAVKKYCQNHTQGTQIEIGACYQGYIWGYDGTVSQSKYQSKCNDSYQNKPNAIKACKQGYNGGVNNDAGVKSPRKGGGGGGGGGAGGGGTVSDKCGNNPSVGVAINIGCRGQGNPIADMLFAIIRILSAGVGLVVVGSIVVGGIQYSASRGDPQATALAINRIRSSLFALLIYIFGFALLNYIIPGAVLQ